MVEAAASARVQKVAWPAGRGWSSVVCGRLAAAERGVPGAGGPAGERVGGLVSSGIEVWQCGWPASGMSTSGSAGSSGLPGCGCGAAGGGSAAEPAGCGTAGGGRGTAGWLGPPRSGVGACGVSGCGAVGTGAAESELGSAVAVAWVSVCMACGSCSGGVCARSGMAVGVVSPGAAACSCASRASSSSTREERAARAGEVSSRAQTPYLRAAAVRLESMPGMGMPGKQAVRYWSQAATGFWRLVAPKNLASPSKSRAVSCWSRRRGTMPARSISQHRRVVSHCQCLRPPSRRTFRTCWRSHMASAVVT